MRHERICGNRRLEATVQICIYITYDRRDSMEDEIQLTSEQEKAIADTRNWLMQQIDLTNDLEIEKVNRYCNLLNIFYYLDNEIYVRGAVIEVGNGNQTFVKPNPCLAEKNKVNGSLLAIEKSFNLEKRAEEKRKNEAAKGPELT